MNTRQQDIVNLLQQSRQVNVRELAQQFAVSEMTIRRDLTQLQEHGVVVRTHGGGIAVGKIEFLQSAYPHYVITPAKRGIGALAAGLVQPGQTIMVDTGTTALEVARHLPHHSGITVATNSLCVAQELYGTPINVLLLGGFLRKEFPSLYGPVTEGMLKNLHVDILFIGCDGADSTAGFYSTDINVASLEKAMIGITSRIVVVTESTKFGKRAFSRYATPQEIHTVVTDSCLSAQDRANLEERGATVLIAEPEKE
ncbi:MAG: DeoR/GlpR family DNA-binding transcription regulator [Armatimonadota bacterium]